MPNYGDPKYWVERYRECEETFDWLEDYATLKSFIEDLNLEKMSAKILNIGCGNSTLSEEMYDDGYSCITNIDIADNVIDQMKIRNAKRAKMIWQRMDVRRMTFSSNTFNLILDKSTIDALLCGDQAAYDVAKMLKEVQRVLKLGGYYMIISYGAPENRLVHLQREFLNFDITIFTIKKSTENGNDVIDKLHYIYLCKKIKDDDDESNALYKQILDAIEKEDDEDNEPDNNDEDNEDNNEEDEEDEYEEKQDNKKRK